MMKHNTKYILFASVMSLLAAAGCQREDLSVNNSSGDDVLNFSIGFAGSGELVLTKGTTLTSEDGTVSIPLSCTVTDGIEVDLPEAAGLTKSTQINSEAEFLGAELTGFTAAGWNSDKTEFIPDPTIVSYVDGLWQTASTYRWRGSDDKVFLAYANLPTSGAAVLNSADPVKQTFTYTVPTDARQQNDIMLGWYEGYGGGTATAAITMLHPLTAVVFKKGEMEGVTAIKSISIVGVYTSGQTDVTYALSGNEIVPTYNWGSSRTGSQTVTLDPAEGATALEIADNGKIGTSFIILPQTVAEGALMLKITVVRDGEDVGLAATIPAGTWEAGKTNTYTLGYSSSDPDLLPGKFSVSANEYVQFSRGNLYCTRSGSEGSYTYDFGLEQHQYDFHTRPEGPSAINGVYDEEGTDPNMSGHFYWDIAKAQAGKDYGAFSTTAPSGGTTSDVLDWGPALDAASHWTTLSNGEWNYLISTRKVKSASGLGNTCQFVIVKGVKGLIIYPDDYDGDMFTSLQEITVIPTGCVFIPMAGKFVDGGTTNVNERCNYWTSTHGDAGGNAIQFLAYGTVCHANNLLGRANGMSVRLVQKFKKPLPEIEFIDLGLPSGTLWADKNVGATSVTDMGDHYPWGETEEWYSSLSASYDYTMKSEYSGGFTAANYNSLSNMKSINANLTGAYEQYDVAAATYGDGCRMPSNTEFDELKANCYWRTVTSYGGASVEGVVAFKVQDSSHKGKFNQSYDSSYNYDMPHIFIPNNGYGQNKVLRSGTMGSGDKGANAGYYWLSDYTAHSFSFSAKLPSRLEDDSKRPRYLALGVRPVKKFVKSHEYVEIGGLKWATCNVGANTPKDYGWYFFWGGTTGYKREGSKWVKASDTASELSGGFSWAKTPYHTGVSETTNWSKYIPTNRSTYWTGGGSPDNKLSLELVDDAARANWGGSWRMPTQAEFQTLYEACGGTGVYVGTPALPSANPGKGIYWVSNSQTYISDYNGVAGILFCDGVNKLFFVAAGYGTGEAFYGDGSEGRYWSGNVFSTNPQNAYRLGFQTGNVSPENVNNRYQGYPVRPVSD